MGQPAVVYTAASRGNTGSERRELKHLSTCRKRKRLDFPSSGERKGSSLNRVRAKPVRVAYPGSWVTDVPLYGAGEESQNQPLAEVVWNVRP